MPTIEKKENTTSFIGHKPSHACAKYVSEKPHTESIKTGYISGKPVSGIVYRDVVERDNGSFSYRVSLSSIQETRRNIYTELNGKLRRK